MAGLVWSGDGANAQGAADVMVAGKTYVVAELPPDINPAAAEAIGKLFRDLAADLQDGRVTPEEMAELLQDAVPMLSGKAQVIAEDLPMLVPFLHKKLSILDDFQLGLIAIHILSSIQKQPS